MKLTVFFTFVAVLQATAGSMAQTITLRSRNLPLSEVMEEVKKQSGFHFFLKGENLATLRVNTSIRQAPLENAMELLTRNLGVEWVIKDNIIILRQAAYNHKPAPPPVTFPASQDRIVQGKVTDENNLPLARATVTVKGTQAAATTDDTGNYRIVLPSGGQTLVFSIVGFETTEADIGNQTVINIMLKPSISDLDEVVVVGYGTQKKANLTGAVSVVGHERLENRAMGSVAEALQGVTPGLNVQEHALGSEPGSERSVNVRGVGTLSGNGGQPYVLVDGLPMDIGAVDPDNIENISVLKDAAASAIYGSRAPYGVILITTKTGKAGKTLIEYRQDYALQHPTMIPHYAGSIDVAKAHNYMTANSGIAGISAEQMARIEAYYKGEIDNETIPATNQPTRWALAPGAGSHANNDWPYLFWDNWAPQEKYSLSASGQEGRTNYYLSGIYFEQQDVMSWGDFLYKKYDFMSNLSTSVNDWIKLNLNTKYIRKNVRRPMSGRNLDRGYQYGWIYTNTPMHTLYSPNGDLVGEAAREFAYGGKEFSTDDNYWMKIGGTLEPIKGWTTNINYIWNQGSDRLTIDRKTITQATTTPGEYYAWRFVNPSFEDRHQRLSYHMLNAVSNYEKEINNHHFNILIGYEQEYSEQSGLGGEKFGIVSPVVPSVRTGLGDFFENSSWTHWSTRGFFSRATYSYGGKYLFEVNSRYDGSSRFFGADNQWGWFPSVSAGYNISQEAYWDPLRQVVNNWKIRASWGSLGNQDVNNYLYLPIVNTLTTLNWIVGNTRPNYTTMPNLVSPQLTWETAQTINLGTDLAFFSNRLNVSFDWYRRKTLNMMGPAEALPATLGTSPSVRNNAELETNVFDLNISWKQSVNQDLSYSLDLMVGDNRSVVTAYNNPNNYIYSWYQGKRVGEIWGYVTDGIFQADGEVANHANQTDLYDRWQAGDIRYKDLNDDDRVNHGQQTLDNSGDLTIIGNFEPRYQFGFNTTVSYKAFSVNMFWQGVAKRDYYFVSDDQWSRFWPFRGNANSKGLIQGIHLDYWTPEGADHGGGPDAYYARPYASSEYYKNTLPQTRYLQDASYLRLKNIGLSYSISPKQLSRYISRIRLNFSAHNALTFTGLPLQIDPEMLSNDAYYGGTGTTVYHTLKSYRLGIDLTF